MPKLDKACAELLVQEFVISHRQRMLVAPDGTSQFAPNTLTFGQTPSSQAFKVFRSQFEPLMTTIGSNPGAKVIAGTKASKLYYWNRRFKEKRSILQQSKKKIEEKLNALNNKEKSKKAHSLFEIFNRHVEMCIKKDESARKKKRKLANEIYYLKSKERKKNSQIQQLKEALQAQKKKLKT